MEQEPKLNMGIDPVMRDAAAHQLHELELSAEDNISNADYEAFKSLMVHMQEREGDRKLIHPLAVNPDHLGKLEALMYRWARTIKEGTDEFERFTKEKDSIESLLRESRGTSNVESLLAFYEFLTNLIEAPMEKRTP